jgi:FMN phosphatase YigB (HAD superfamily)
VGAALFNDYAISREEILFIGDSQQNDFDGPKKHGMKVVTPEAWQMINGVHDPKHFAARVGHLVWWHNNKFGNTLV